MKIDVNHVSISEGGDERFHVAFETEPEGQDDDKPYLIIQRDFEPPDAGRCYVETHDPEYTGRVRFASAELSRRRFIAMLERKQANEVDVTFQATDADYRDLARVLRIMLPR